MTYVPLLFGVAGGLFTSLFIFAPSEQIVFIAYLHQLSSVVTVRAVLHYIRRLCRGCSVKGCRLVTILSGITRTGYRATLWPAGPMVVGWDSVVVAGAQQLFLAAALVSPQWARAKQNSTVVIIFCRVMAYFVIVWYSDTDLRLQFPVTVVYLAYPFVMFIVYRYWLFIMKIVDAILRE